MTPRAALKWEVTRAGRPELVWRPTREPRPVSLVVLACAAALLAGVAFRLIDSWVVWP